jgi:anti-sigma B factor antagonist
VSFGRDKTPLKTEVTEHDGVHRLAVHGRITIDSSPDLLEEFRRVVRHARQLDVDLHDVPFVDSSGISVLIQGLKMAQERSVDFALLDPSPKVKAVIELSQLDSFFTVKISAGAG